MKTRIFILIISYLVLFSSNNSAQKKVIELWNGNIPGSIKNTSYIEDTIKLDDGKKRIRRVVTPTLSIYPANPNNANGIAIVVCPGGGYTRLAVDNEGEGVAKWLNNAGITAAILKYRLPNDSIMKDKSIGPLQDVQEAIRILRKNSELYNISPQKIGTMGFSAGGHLASTLSVRFDDKVYDAENISARPDFSVLVYPVISMKPGITHKGSSDNLLGQNPSAELIDKFSNELHVKKNTPPSFIVHAQDDKSVPVQNSLDYFYALKKNDIPAELHIYTVGGHGFGLAKGRKTTVNQWPEACIKWIEEIIPVK